VEIVKFGKDNPATLKKYMLEGPLFFGTAKIFEDAYPVILTGDVKTIILDMEQTSVIDATGEAALSKFIDEARNKDIQIIIKKLPKEKLSMFKNGGLYDKIGEENFFM
jgi:sulfate permease, SulP family